MVVYVGVTEEGGKVAGSAIEALKGNPLCLSLVVLIAIVGGLAYLRMQKQMEIDDRTVTNLIDHCMGPAKR